MNLDDLYRRHPISAKNILARVERQRGSLAGISEWDLAVDSASALTDQNHPGGVDAVLEMAVAAKVDGNSRVIDIGAGIGGSARVLASAFGCSVLGVDRSAGRCADAVDLTARVRVPGVEFVVHDGEQSSLAFSGADVLWGQSAWIHFDLKRFLGMWVSMLRPDGRVVTTDTHLADRQLTKSDRTLLRYLEGSWGGHLRPIGTWLEAFSANRLQLTYRADRSIEYLSHFRRLRIAASNWPDGTVTAAERLGWDHAIAAFEEGLVVSNQLVAIRI